MVPSVDRFTVVCRSVRVGPLALALVLALAGCGPRQTDLERARDLRATVAACRAAITDEAAPPTAKQSTRQRRRAEKAAGALRKLVKASRDPAVQEVLQGLDDDLAAIRRADDLAVCREKLRHELGHLTIRGYLAGRRTLLAGTLKGLALAARHADSATPAVDAPADQPAGAATPAAAVHSAALVASAVQILRFAGARAGAPATAGEQPAAPPDWEDVAAGLEELASQPPPELNLLLAVGYLSGGQRALALAELETCDAGAFRETAGVRASDKRVCHQLLRGLTLHAFGWAPLADEAFDIVALEMGRGDPLAVDGLGERRDALTLWHAAMAAYYGQQRRDFRRMDEHLAWLVRLNPDSDEVTYLTGQRRAADGTWEATAKSMESDLRGSPDEAVARVLAGRLRAVRDSAPLEPPPAIASSPWFVLRLASAWASSRAQHSAAARRLADWLGAARRLTGALGRGGNAPDPGSTAVESGPPPSPAGTATPAVQADGGNQSPPPPAGSRTE